MSEYVLFCSSVFSSVVQCFLYSIISHTSLRKYSSISNTGTEENNVAPPVLSENSRWASLKKDEQDCESSRTTTTRVEEPRNRSTVDGTILHRLRASRRRQHRFEIRDGRNRQQVVVVAINHLRKQRNQKRSWNSIDVLLQFVRERIKLSRRICLDVRLWRRRRRRNQLLLLL